MAILDLAIDVISRTDRRHPADQMMRDVMKANRDLDARDAAAVARAVFRYFRWQGWLDDRDPLADQIGEAAQWAENFRREPQRFSNEDLASRAIPAWTHQELKVDPAWLRALQTEPALWLRARPGQGDALAAKLGHSRSTRLGGHQDALVYTGDEDLFRSPEFHAGEFEVQDLSSQAVGFICAPRSGETWWDACAGEGGKLLHLSDLMENRGLIWATDRAAWRLSKLRRRAARARVFNYRAVIWSDPGKPPTKTKFDGVLVDAPCSGVGTWQRNPHARWSTDPQDVAELAAVQKNLLTVASSSVKPGGRLVYSVCTLTRSETQEVADHFEKMAPGFEPLTISHPLRPKASPSARLQMVPQDDGGNGMFVAMWKRVQ